MNKIMNAADQNWANLFLTQNSNCGSWHGLWTSYNTNQEFIQQKKVIRDFHSNSEGTIVDHQNTYLNEDGSSSKQKWEIDKLTSNQPDGVIHPAATSMRTLASGNGESVWISKQLEIGQLFGGEFFFRHQNWRNSVVILYGQKGIIDRLTLICEHDGNFPDSYPKEVIDDLEDDWIGSTKLMTPDLNLIEEKEPKKLTLKIAQPNYQTFNLPGSFIIQTPVEYKVGESFKIQVGKLITKNQYKQISANYNNQGQFEGILWETFERVVMN
ncbi:MAG TPA: hypothetical protein DCF68_02635 [Cyanothece sp. UBA12306]|nr:hypothetical protein [Cyanothece sp. UBA12306]